MPMFLKVDDLYKKHGFFSVDKMIQIEMKEFDIEYEYENEGEYIKINFLTEEIKNDRKSKSIIIEKLKNDLLIDEFSNNNFLDEKMKEKLINDLLSKLKNQYGSYSEVLNKYNEIILPSINRVQKMLKSFMNIGGNIMHL